MGNAFRWIGIASFSALLLISGTALGAGGTTVDRIILDANGDNLLEFGPGEQYTVREDLAAANPNREETRTPVFRPIIQLSDFQLTDEESPARIEGLDSIGGTVYVNGAYHPQESLESQTIDTAVRRVNRVRSPVTGRRPSLTLVSGDSADSNQQNETELYIDILNGGSVDPNSGDPNYKPFPCGTWPFTYPTDLYQGVRGGGTYYEPDGGGDGPGYSTSESQNFSDTGRHVATRDFPGLFDAANTSFTAEGLRTPWLAVFGNHDALWQGNFTGVTFPAPSVTGCLKDLDGNLIATDVVEPDPERALVTHQQWIEAHLADGDGHGFDANQPDTGYYSVPVPGGLRVIGLDSVNDDGLSNGIIRDDSLGEPDQFGWLDQELTSADQAGETVIVYAHHSLVSMNNTDVFGSGDQHCGLESGASQTPGAISCDQLSQNGNESLEELFYRHPSVIGYVSGHEHNNRATPRDEQGGPGSFWEIVLASESDWPQQSGMLEIFNNQDGTFSIFRTVIDHSPVPNVGNSPDLTNPLTLASISREIAFNDPQGSTGEDGTSDARGTLDDRNVELLVEK